MTEPGPGMQEMRRADFYDALKREASRRRFPLEATIELTYGCNLRCVHCYNPTHRARGELSGAEFAAILEALKASGCLFITFSGGEMFTRRDAFDILGHAKGLGMVLTLFTNAASITPERADRIADLKPRQVEASIYGATQETYEAVTKVKGSYQAFLRGVRLLRERGIPLVAKMPVVKLNRREAVSARDLVQGWGMRFVYCVEITPRSDGSPEPLRYRLDPREVLELEREMAARRPGARHNTDPPHKEKKECPAGAGLFHCSCGKSSLAITPYGEMNLCVNFPLPRYDLRAGPVAQGWQALKDFVDSAAPGPAYECPSCDLHGHCRRGVMDSWLEKGDLSACVPYYKELAGLEKQAS